MSPVPLYSPVLVYVVWCFHTGPGLASQTSQARLSCQILHCEAQTKRKTVWTGMGLWGEMHCLSGSHQLWNWSADWLVALGDGLSWERRWDAEICEGGSLKCYVMPIFSPYWNATAPPWSEQSNPSLWAVQPPLLSPCRLCGVSISASLPDYHSLFLIALSLRLTSVPRTQTHSCTRSPTRLVDWDLSCSPVSPWSLVHLNPSPPSLFTLPVTPNRGWSNYSTCLRTALPQRHSCMRVCVFLLGRRETLLSVGSSEPSCHAMQGVVLYHWLSIKAGIYMEAASVQLFSALPLSSLCLSSSL